MAPKGACFGSVRGLFQKAVAPDLHTVSCAFLARAIVDPRSEAASRQGVDPRTRPQGFGGR